MCTSTWEQRAKYTFTNNTHSEPDMSVRQQQAWAVGWRHRASGQWGRMGQGSPLTAPSHCSQSWHAELAQEEQPRPAIELGQPGMAKGTRWLRSQDKEARAGDGQGRNGCSVVHGGKQCQGRSCSAAPELRDGLQRRLLRDSPHDWSVSSASPHQSLMALSTGNQAPVERGGGCSVWCAQGPDAHITFKTLGVRSPLSM